MTTSFSCGIFVFALMGVLKLVVGLVYAEKIIFKIFLCPVVVFLVCFSELDIVFLQTFFYLVIVISLSNW